MYSACTWAGKTSARTRACSRSRLRVCVCVCICIGKGAQWAVRFNVPCANLFESMTYIGSVPHVQINAFLCVHIACLHAFMRAGHPAAPRRVLGDNGRHFQRVGSRTARARACTLHVHCTHTACKTCAMRILAAHVYLVGSCPARTKVLLLLVLASVFCSMPRAGYACL